MTGQVHIRSLVLLSLWAWGAPPGTLALDPSKALSQYHLDVWTERDGLPQGSVEAITQTRDGYLWVGTRDGLARFDGVAFTVFRQDNTPALLANDVRALCGDRAGQLWVGTFNGGLYRYAQGLFTRYSVKEGLPAGAVLQLLVDPRGDLWCSTAGGLARLRGGDFVTLQSNTLRRESGGWTLGQDARGQVWAAHRSGVYRLQGDRLEPLSASGEWPAGPWRECFADFTGTVWLLSASGELWRLWEGALVRYAERHQLPEAEIRAVLLDQHTNLWLGTWSGLWRLRGGGLSVLARADGLPHDHVEALFEDRDGSIWIGTRGGGLARLSDGTVSNFTTREGLAHDFAKCVLEDRSGAIWIGTHGGGLSRYAHGRFTHFGPAEGLPSRYVWSLAEDRQGGLWVGTGRPAGLSHWTEGRWVGVGAGEGLPIENGVRALFVDEQDNVWMGGDGGGLVRFGQGAFRRYTTADGLPSDFIRVIHGSRDGTLWIGTTGGLARFEAGQFAVFTTDDGLAHNVVYAIHQDAEGTLWLGTQGGLTRYSNGRFRSYTSRDGLFHDVIYQVLEDDHATLWMSSNRGLFRLAKQAVAEFDQGRRQRLPCVAYGVADGMKSTQCEGATQPAGWRTRAGQLWFPTANGVAVIDPACVQLPRDPPPLVIEQVLADGRPVAPGQSAKLPPGVRELRFQFTALSFLAPDKTWFRHKLEGYDKQWTSWSQHRGAVYQDLPPGRYRFRVAARESDGDVPEAQASFAFQLPPPFYQTLWFYGLGVVALVAAAYAWHRWRMRQAQARFALVLAERSRIARDLHDTLAQGFAGIAFQLEAVAAKLTESPAQAQAHLRLALDMVRHSLAEARRSVLNLRSTSLERGGLAAALKETARQLIADRPVILEVREQGPARPLPPPLEENLLHLGQEAITNALKHAHPRHIQVQLDFLPAAVRLSVRDDGRGFDPQTSAARNGAHFGLIGMRERARQMDGQLDLRSSPHTGTEVIVEVPVPAWATRR